MKKIIAFLLVIFSLISFAFAQTYVKGYYKKDGTYVKGYYRSDRDNTNHNNYSTSGNTNPYTQKKGNIAKDYSPQTKSYGSGRAIHTGPKGGQYYINSKGNKTYVPKRKN